MAEALLELRWTSHATTQLASIAEYISVDSPVYAEAVVARIVARLQQACAFPESGRRVRELDRDDLRELIELPYRVVYRIRSDAIEVVSVVHGRQDLLSALSAPHRPA